jgi:hypothetical protein
MIYSHFIYSEDTTHDQDKSNTSSSFNKLSLSSPSQDDSSKRPLKGKLNENSKSFKPRFLKNRNVGPK